MPKYLIFPDPLDSHCELTIADGRKLVAIQDHHSSGRQAQSFNLNLTPPCPQGNGAFLSITADGRVTLSQNGILWYRDANTTFPFPEGDAFLMTDDFRLQPMPVAPPVTPPVNQHPIDIINSVYKTGLYDLTTREGCGTFTEACCTALHNEHSAGWGHVRKVPGQEQYNGHAVDAIMLLNNMSDANRAIYDIIVQSMAPDAHPAFNYASPADPSLWYYPA